MEITRTINADKRYYLDENLITNAGLKAEDIDYLKRLCKTENINSIEIAEIDYKLINYIENNTSNS